MSQIELNSGKTQVYGQNQELTKTYAFSLNEGEVAEELGLLQVA